MNQAFFIPLFPCINPNPLSIILTNRSNTSIILAVFVFLIICWKVKTTCSFCCIEESDSSCSISSSTIWARFPSRQLRNSSAKLFLLCHLFNYLIMTLLINFYLNNWYVLNMPLILCLKFCKITYHSYSVKMMCVLNCWIYIWS